MIHTREINDFEELTHYRMAWNALWPQTRNATFFQSFDWLETYWRHFGANQRLRVIMVFDGAHPVGIMPLVVRTESTRVGRLRMLTYPLHDWGTFYGPIGPGPSATMLLALRHVRETARDWDLLDLRWIDQDGCDYSRTPTAMRLAGFHPHRQAWNRAAVVDLQGTWDAYWQGQPKRWRRDVDRVTQRLAGQGDLRLVRYRPEGAACGDGDPRWDLYDACADLAQKSWQGESIDGTTLCHPSVAQYLRDAHAAAARIGNLDLNLLTLSGRPIAFAYNYCCHGRVCGLRKGFDPQFAHFRPGIVLQRMLIEDSFRRGDSHFDMGAGHLESKLAWQTGLVTSYRYTHFPLSVPRAQVLRLKRWLQSRLAGQHDVACA